MERVKKGERYWSITLDYGGVRYWENTESDVPENYRNWETNNYFHTRAEAEAMAGKLRAVLKGAEVIEMPSEEDFYNEEFKTNHYFFAKDGAAAVGAHQIGFKHCYDWLKSKIVK